MCCFHKGMEVSNQEVMFWDFHSWERFAPLLAALFTELNLHHKLALCSSTGQYTNYMKMDQQNHWQKAISRTLSIWHRDSSSGVGRYKKWVEASSDKVKRNYINITHSDTRSSELAKFNSTVICYLLLSISQRSVKSEESESVTMRTRLQGANFFSENNITMLKMTSWM